MPTITQDKHSDATAADDLHGKAHSNTGYQRSDNAEGIGKNGCGSITMFVLGVIVGIIGLLGMGVNYPIYKKLLAQGKQKYAFEIMELAKEISEM